MSADIWAGILVAVVLFGIGSIGAIAWWAMAWVVKVLQTRGDCEWLFVPDKRKRK